MQRQVLSPEGIPQQIEIGVDLLRRFDPVALSPLIKDDVRYHSCKRALDLVLVVPALVLMAPLMVMIAVLIILDSGWPVIFAQERVGAQRWTRNGFSYWRRTSFTMYKFRSMVPDADPAVHRAFIKAFTEARPETPHAAAMSFKSNDCRITRIGRLLRKTSLDELPQLLNVLRNEMSMVGPRPVPRYEVAEYRGWHRERLAALPGITGLWQVSGRSLVSFDRSVRMDIEYVRRKSLWLDLKILFLTVPTVLTGRGAD